MPTLSWALPSDSEQPIEIEADHAQLDDVNGVTQYKGNAILTQGTLRIEGDIITFYYDENKQLIKAIADGNLAKYQQVHAKGEKPVRARAYKMEYYAKTQLIYLIGKGYIWQNGDEFNGDHIEYNIAKNLINARSDPDEMAGSTAKKNRVHIIIHPVNANGEKVIAPKAALITKITPSQNATNKTVSKPPIPSVPSATIDENKIYPTARTTANLNVRTGPNLDHKKIGTFTRGSLLTILTEQKKWLQVRGVVKNKPVIGWIVHRYVDRH